MPKSNIQKWGKCPRCRGLGEVRVDRRKKEPPMKQEYQAIIDDVTKAAALDDAKDQQILDLKAQVAALTPPPPPPTPKIVTISNIQSVLPESLWYEARGASSPKSGPHGTITIVPGSPATADFKPMLLADRSSDNVYNLRRLYPTLTPAEHLIMESATHFSISCDYLLDPLANVQAAELDYQIRKSSGVVINVGPQLLPVSGGWIIRGFDFVNKKWVPLGVRTMLQTGKTIHLQVDATCDGKTVQFVRVIVDGIETLTNFSHPVSQSILGAPYCNAAYQLDATADAKPYRATVDHLTVTFA